MDVIFTLQINNEDIDNDRDADNDRSIHDNTFIFLLKTAQDFVMW